MIEVDEKELAEIGKNVKAVLKGKHLVIVVDVSQEIGESASGKMMMVASTSGFTNLPGHMKANINIGKKH
jgi:hypothetical protein